MTPSNTLTLENARHHRRYVPSGIRVWRGVVWPRRRILCKAEALRPTMLLSRIFARNGYRAVLDPAERHDISLKIPSDQARVVVNARHQNNRKTHVAKLWFQASGQRLAVDPLCHTGPLVEKSDANAKHDGRVLTGPLDARDLQNGKVYHRLIDNRQGDEVLDLRVTFHGRAIPLVYRKYRPLDARFSNTNSRCEIVETDDVFDRDEQALLLYFAELAGLDFGEADVLRDAGTGQIWVVDITQGPAGPPNGLTPQDNLRAVQRLAAAFDAMLDAAAR